MVLVLTQAVGAVYGEAHEDDVSVWVGERSQPVVVLLAGCVPKSQLHLKHNENSYRWAKVEGVWGNERRGRNITLYIGTRKKQEL